MRSEVAVGALPAANTVEGGQTVQEVQAVWPDCAAYVPKVHLVHTGSATAFPAISWKVPGVHAMVRGQGPTAPVLGCVSPGLHDAHGVAALSSSSVVPGAHGVPALQERLAGGTY